jgi:hypothetical protein
VKKWNGDVRHSTPYHVFYLSEEQLDAFLDEMYAKYGEDAIRQPVSDDDKKVCAKCLRVLPGRNFAKDSYAPMGRCDVCKDCS